LNSSLNGFVAGIAPILAGYIAEYGTILQISSKTSLNIIQTPIHHLFASTIQITGLDLVMVISGIVGIGSVIAIHFLIPSQLTSNSEIIIPAK